MNDVLDRTTYETVSFQNETSQAPKIKSGGSSSSDILNRYFMALSQDLSLFVTRTNKLAERASRLNTISEVQGQTYLNMFNQLSSRVDAVASGLQQVLVDMFSGLYIDPTNEAQIFNKFGQATLPVLSQTDLIVQTDVFGANYISSDTEFSYCETSSASGTPPTSDQFQVDPEGLFMLRGDQSWVHTTSTPSVYVKVKTPVQFLGLSPNVLEIWPMPLGGIDLVGLWYQESGVNADGSWIQVDLSYLPNNIDGVCKQITPLRIHLPNDTISQFCFSFNLNDCSDWGIYKIKLYHVEYNSPANLIITNPYNQSVGQVLLRGKDSSDVLSNLPISTTNNQAVIAISSTNSITTPVITGLIINFN